MNFSQKTIFSTWTRTGLQIPNQNNKFSEKNFHLPFLQASDILAAVIWCDGKTQGHAFKREKN